ncbi:glycogen/starch/alpha-glucan phosphorylase [Sodalis-like endosymbiont of Proechinophthirus fluctus]|uniref:glycogen/starch/alpha-glucan phosphorylase n=1 Tax=Sodalis-like endosymbiont of Proechinophthirus fluctus TaxID=1462730 RepID=UPI000834055C|nr:glycogen/starch/alpha-glucan phosphorylase [Sodalis-like endosymbiont of Proechinophthirus fluctus]
MQVEAPRSYGYNPRSYYEQDAELHLALSQIATSGFDSGEPGRYSNLFDSLANFEDQSAAGRDYRSYVDA